MIIAVMTVLLLLCAAVLIYPFLVRGGETSELGPGEDIAEQLRRARDRVYEDIRALQQEYFLENLTEEEYQTQLQAARRRAAELIRQQQQVQATLQAVEAQVEQEMRLAAIQAGSAEDRSTQE
jgi:hypothetical protein